MRPRDSRAILRESVPGINGHGRAGGIRVTWGRGPSPEPFRAAAQDRVDRTHRFEEVRA